jgi:hypothetical protein
LPLPSGASGASAFRALNVGPMSLTVRDGALALELELEGAGLAAVGAEMGLLPGLQAAISSAALRPAAVRPALFLRPAVFAREDKNVPRFSLTRLAAAAGVGPPGERVCKPCPRRLSVARLRDLCGRSPQRPRPGRRPPASTSARPRRSPGPQRRVGLGQRAVPFRVGERTGHDPLAPRGVPPWGDEQAATCHSSWSLLPSAARLPPGAGPVQARCRPGAGPVQARCRLLIRARTVSGLSSAVPARPRAARHSPGCAGGWRSGPARAVRCRSGRRGPSRP